MSSCIFGTDAESFKHDKPLIREKAKQIFGNSSRMYFRMIILLIFPALTKFFKFGLVPMDVQDFFRELMAHAIEQRKQSSRTRQDYLDYLLQLQEKKGHSDLEVAANAITFFLDGLDTSAVGISGILYELGKNRDVQVRLREEIYRAIGDSGRLDYETVSELEYLDNVFYGKVN